MEFDLIDIDERKKEICEQTSFEIAHTYAAKLINDLAAERDKLLNGICPRCEDKQACIDALNAYVKRLTDSSGTHRKYIERVQLEHRVEELSSDDFASVYFDLCDKSIELAKAADGLAAALEDIKKGH